MDFLNYKIIWSKSFKKDLKGICNYVLYTLKEPLTVKELYFTIITSLQSLQYFPKRYYKISTYFNSNNKDIRKLVIRKYIIIYEVNDMLRRSYYSTYISSEVKII